MSVRGWVQGCEWQERGSELTADVASGGLVLVVEDITDFDDAAGVIRLNDQILRYSDGAIDEDAGTITLDSPIGVGANVGDKVYAVSGGQIMQDVILYVSCGDGDAVEINVGFTQRDYWPEQDEYDEPVQVVLSDDLERILEVPGRIPESVELKAVVGDTSATLEEIYDAANAAAAAAATAAAIGTAAGVAANGKNTVTWSASGPGVTPNTAGDIWWQRSGSLIAGQWVGLGGTSWQSQTLAGAVIAYLDAGQLTAGSAFVNGLQVLTNFTLGDASTNGVIQSYNFAGSPVGVYIDKFGLVAKGGSLTGATVTGGVVQTGTAGQRVVMASGVLSLYDSSGSLVGAVAGNSARASLHGPGGAFVDVYGSAVNLGGSVAQVDGDLRVDGDLIVLGSYPSSPSTWVGSATSGLDMNSNPITDVSSLSVNGGTTAGGAGHFNTVFADSVPTTGAAINAVMGGSGQFLMNTSARRYKYDDEPFEIDLAAVRSLTHKRFRRYDDPAYDSDHPEAGRWYYGVIANEAEGLDLTPWCTYDVDGELQSFDYPGFATAVALAVARDYDERLNAQAAETAALTAQLAEMRTFLGIDSQED